MSVQRVATLRGFWHLEKTMLCEIHVNWKYLHTSNLLAKNIIIENSIGEIRISGNHIGGGPLYNQSSTRYETDVNDIMSRNYLLKQSPPHEKGWFLSTAQKCTENALDMKNWHSGLTEHFQIKWGTRMILYKISAQKWSLKLNFPFFLHGYFYNINVPTIQLKLGLLNW